ncbi:MGMT family protein [Fructilactobacillus fructivorans]|uniref:Methylated-DNA--[protein]-cysteine S-methyltransferase n=1 Tax=Fructilactobacillus fructivorans TaxID=1614 RepID=A0AAE6P0N6_9LACO|nr:MGMT family protein [Fructilactobacillus fructivorans]KRK58235.1 methylated-DNA protein-cysteine methyltransferase [Fructilactobacillus fructivorans]QFX92223.1 methylated-DNA--[protein]-cysteine S-methyltransferase [Fructilactobacillus fructivorans]RDV65272.1 methylated-DNA--[protein]-cysteine S-methyltransferase [Fructilactobacillus fructivorans]
MQRLYWDSVHVNGDKIFFTIDDHGLNFVSSPGQGVSQLLDFYTNDHFEYAKNSERSLLYRKTIKNYLRGKSTDLDLPIDFMSYGSDEGRLIWNEIAQIPFGELVTVSDLADQSGLGPDKVELAISKSPIWLVLPLHRVTDRNGRYPYRTGDTTRDFLVDLEHPKK